MKRKHIFTVVLVTMLLVTLLVTYSARVFTMPQEEVLYETYRDKLSDTEVDEYNKRKVFQTPLQHQQGYRNYRYDEVKITRKRTTFGWETKIDTLKSYVKLEDCGC